MRDSRPTEVEYEEPLRTLRALQFLKDSGYVSPKPLGDGRWAALFRFMFTWAIVVGRVDDMNTYDNRWCYHTEGAARVAFENWSGDGEPDGWHRHPLTGRRRGENGEEYINF